MILMCPLQLGIFYDSMTAAQDVGGWGRKAALGASTRTGCYGTLCEGVGCTLPAIKGFVLAGVVSVVSQLKIDALVGLIPE